MNIYRTTRLVIFFLLWPFHSVVAQSDLPDPREILLKAQQALLEIQSLSYHAEYYELGLHEFSGKPSIGPAGEGDVRFAGIPEEDPFGIKFYIDSKWIKTSTDGSGAAFTTAYDGQKVRQLDHGKEIAYVNDPDPDGAFLLVKGGFYTLLMSVFNVKNTYLWEGPLKEPFQIEIAVDDLGYEGVAVVGGVPCHIIHIPIHETHRFTESWWFIGMDDNLPRKEQVVLYDDNGKVSLQRIHTITGLKVNEAVEPSAYALYAPETYAVKVYEVRGNQTLGLAVGKNAPNWTLAGVDGKNLSLRDLRGQVVVMDFWATWCGPCLAAMPDVQKLHEQFGDQGVVVLGISTWETGDPAALMKEKGYTYPLLLNGDDVAEEYGIPGIPTTFVIGRDGKILYGQVGNRPDDHAKWNEVIGDALAGK